MVQALKSPAYKTGRTFLFRESPEYFKNQIEDKAILYKTHRKLLPLFSGYIKTKLNDHAGNCSARKRGLG